MAQTRDGNKKIFCNRNGITLLEYDMRVEAGLKHCTKCKDWHPKSMFTVDNSRYDGLKASCNSKGCGTVLVPKSHKGRISTFKGRKHTPEARKKMSAANLGHNHRLGIKHTDETRAKISKTRKSKNYTGAKCYQWKGGVSLEMHGERALPKYDEWRLKVFKRDGFTCQSCGDKSGGNLEGHHLNGFSFFPKQRFWLSNGITLCKTCHKSFHDAFGYTKNTRQQFKKWDLTRKLSGPQP